MTTEEALQEYVAEQLPKHEHLVFITPYGISTTHSFKCPCRRRA